jgi:hypothetical protein
MALARFKSAVDYLTGYVKAFGDNSAYIQAVTLVDSTGADASATLPTGAATSAKQDTIIGHVDGIEALLGGSLIVVGNVAHDAVDSGAPIKLGGIAFTQAGFEAVGAVANLDRVNGAHTTNGARITTSWRKVAGGDDRADGLSAGAISTDNSVTCGLMVHNYYWDGANWQRIRGDKNGTVALAGLTSTFWNYAAATLGIVNTTTAVTIKTAAGAGVSNCIAAFQLMWEALGTATEFAIRDGAGGTVLWRMKIPAGVAGCVEVSPRVPLRSTANTLLEIVTLTASTTGAVYFNCQGHTAV